MTRQIAILGAPSAIGIRLYDDGTVRRLGLAPAALRAQGLVQRLSAHDEGDVTAPPYRELVRPPNRIRNEADVAMYSEALAGRVAKAGRAGEFVLFLGGECSFVLGSLLGFAGRGPLATLRGDEPLVAGKHAVMIGRRDDDDDRDGAGKDALAEFGVLDLDGPTLARIGFADAARAALERVTQEPVTGFWIHLDADFIDPSEMPAVDSPVSGGPTIDQVVELVTPLARHPKALGMELTIYDPWLDPDGKCAA